jgi:hypothetical protein
VATQSSATSSSNSLWLSAMPSNAAKVCMGADELPDTALMIRTPSWKPMRTGRFREELRLIGLEERIEADLAIGRHQGMEMVKSRPLVRTAIVYAPGQLLSGGHRRPIWHPDRRLRRDLCDAPHHDEAVLSRTARLGARRPSDSPFSSGRPRSVKPIDKSILRSCCR